jgi:Fur family zinc uptake transcriptional regulator
MNATSAEKKRLTKNQRMVLDVLESEPVPMTAYSILDHLRHDGLKAPLQVYRALDKLTELRAVHRLESLNSFVACQQADCQLHQTVAFTICDACGHVDEISNNQLSRQLAKLAKTDGFLLSKSTVELRGCCRSCR